METWCRGSPGNQNKRRPRAGGRAGTTNLEGLDDLLRLVVPDVHVAIVEGGQHPGLARVQVDAFDPVRARREAPFDVQLQRLHEISNGYVSER